MLNSNIVLGTETGKEIFHGSQIYLQYKSHDEPGIGFNLSMVFFNKRHLNLITYSVQAIQVSFCAGRKRQGIPLTNHQFR